MESQFNDDQFDFDNSNYADQGVVVLPQPGEYSIKVPSLAKRKNKDTGEVLLVNDKYATLTLNRVEITEPEGMGTHAVFHDVRSAPFKRNGANGQKVAASSMVDLIRSIDVDLSSQISSFEDAVDVAEQELKSGATARVKLGYKATDIDNAKALLQGVEDADKKREIWNANTYYTKAFRRPDGGGYNTVVTTPNGKTLEAKLVIDSFVPSNKQGKTGPFSR